MEARKEIVVAAATGSTDGLGKIGTVLNAASVVVRVATQGYNVGWRVRSDTVHTVQKYRARDVYNTATLTFADGTRIDDTNTFILNGLTYTAEATDTDAAWASRKFYCGGADATADAVQVAALINADATIVPNGSVSVGDTVTIVTTDAKWGTKTYVFTAAAAADYPASVFTQAGNQAAELASLVLAINHRDTITIGTDATSIAAANATDTATGYALSIELIADHNVHTASTAFHYEATTAVSTVAATTEATLIAQANATRHAMLEHYRDKEAHGQPDWANLKLVMATTKASDEATAWTLLNALKVAHAAHVVTAKAAAGDTIVINDLTFTAHASTTTVASREFSISGNASADADELCTCINDATYGVPGVTAVNASGAIALTRTTAEPITLHMHYKHAHPVFIHTKAGGVPGVLAAATGATGELAITPTWVKTITVTSSNGTRLTVASIDIPGVYATSALGVVSLSCTTPGSPLGGKRASVIHFAQGTSDANEAAFADTTLAGTTLVLDGAATVDAAANSSVAGGYYAHSTDGWEYAYLGVTNKSGDGAMALSVGATLY